MPSKTLIGKFKICKADQITLHTYLLEHFSSMILLFYHLPLQQNHALVMSLFMQLHFSGERGKYHGDESALPVTKQAMITLQEMAVYIIYGLSAVCCKATDHTPCSMTS